MKTKKVKEKKPAIADVRGVVRSSALDENGLSLKPQIINDNLWYYELPAGIEIYLNTDVGVIYGLIPWRRIKATMNRYNKHR